MVKAKRSAMRTKARGIRVRAWWVIRNRKQTTIEELLNTLTDGTEKDASSSLRIYFNALTKVGILKKIGKRYLLNMDCGVDAPLYRQSKGEVYIPETHTTIKIEEAS